MVSSFYCLYTFLLDEKHAITIQTEEGPVLRSKAILYENLSETFQMFLSENEDLKGRVSQSKFAEFRPSDVVFQCEKSSLQVCLCRYCSNPKRVLQSSILCKKEFRHLVDVQNDQPVKPQMFVKKIMCNQPTRDCYMRCCNLCKHKTEDLEIQIKSLCEEQEIEMVNYEMWCSTDR